MFIPEPMVVKQMIGKMISHSMLRYCLVGMVNTACGIGLIMLFLDVLAWGYWPSTLLGNGIGMVLSYHLNGKWTFPSHTRSKLKGLGLFIGISLIVYLLSYFISLFLGKWMFSYGGNVRSLSALIGSGFYMILCYFGHKMITFR